MATAAGVIKQGNNGPSPGAGLIFANVCRPAPGFDCVSTESNGFFYIPVNYIPGETLRASASSYDPQNFVPTWDSNVGAYYAIVELRYNPPPPSSCFTGDTDILMVNGTTKRIDKVMVGDVVLGQNGQPNTVVSIEAPLLGNRLLYSFNGSPYFITSEHPILTDTGWKSINPEATAKENPKLIVQALSLGDKIVKLSKVICSDLVGGRTSFSDSVELLLKTESLIKRDAIRKSPDVPLYNLILDGNHSYFANGFLVHNKGDC